MTGNSEVGTGRRLALEEKVLRGMINRKGKTGVTVNTTEYQNACHRCIYTGRLVSGINHTHAGVGTTNAIHEVATGIATLVLTAVVGPLGQEVAGCNQQGRRKKQQGHGSPHRSRGMKDVVRQRHGFVNSLSAGLLPADIGIIYTNNPYWQLL